MCNEEHISFIDHDNIKADKHLNRSQLHLNSYGDEMLERNLVSASRRWPKSINIDSTTQRENGVEIEVDTATVSCGIAPLSSSPNENSTNAINLVGSHEATDNTLVENEPTSLNSIRAKNHYFRIVYVLL